MTNEITDLESKLRKLKQEEEDSKWKELLARYRSIGKYLVGKDIIHLFTNQAWAVTRVTNFEEAYDTSSGGYGQWDSRRHLCLIGEQFHYHANEHQKSFSTDGTVYFEEIVKGLSHVKIGGTNSIGIPLGPKKQWAQPWNRFIELGEMEARQIRLSIGEKSYQDRDYEKASKNLTNFQVYCRLAPEGMYETLAKAYWERVKLAHDLYKELGTTNSFNKELERIPWEKICQ